MTNIPDDIMAKARELLEANMVMGEIDDDTAVFTVAGLLGDIAALLSEHTAQEEEMARLKKKLIAAWNAFGTPSSRIKGPAFDLDDLDYLPHSSGGQLDEQIRALEDQSAASKARVAELEKALRFYADPAHWRTANSSRDLRNQGCGIGYHQTGDGSMEVRESHCGQWVSSKQMVHGGYWSADAGNVARSALTPAKENADAE